MSDLSNVGNNDSISKAKVKLSEIKPNTKLSDITDVKIREYFASSDTNPKDGTLDQFELQEYIKERAKIASSSTVQGTTEEIVTPEGNVITKITKGALTQLYDENKRLLSEITDKGSGIIQRVEYEYNEDGTVSQITYLNNEAVDATKTPVKQSISEQYNSVNSEHKDQKSESPESESPGSKEQVAQNKYKGENKPAASANWTELNGKHFEVIDEPDANGNIPTRPIHGEITIEGEVKAGENPKKFTIKDKDNGQIYTFELDETAEGKVVYRCTSGGGQSFSTGNAYELRTINDEPMLVQMKGTEGYGVALSKSASKGKAQGADEAKSEKGKIKPGGESMTEAEREAKIEEEAQAIVPNLESKNGLNQKLQAQAALIEQNQKAAKHVANLIKSQIAGPSLNSNTKTELEKITPDNVAYVIEQYPELAQDIDDEWGLDTKDVYEYVIKDIQARLKALNLEEPVFTDGHKISEDTSIAGMKNWIDKTVSMIKEADAKVVEAADSNMQAVKAEKAELAKIGNKEKAIITDSNKTLAEAAYADPKLEVLKDEDGDEYVELPDGRRVAVSRDSNGEVKSVWIDKDVDSRLDFDVYYAADNARIFSDKDTINMSSKYYDFNKILELVKLIFGEEKSE